MGRGAPTNNLKIGTGRQVVFNLPEPDTLLLLMLGLAGLMLVRSRRPKSAALTRRANTHESDDGR